MSYRYEHVKLMRVIDGDTVGLSIDLGNHIIWQASFRLAGINAPERGQPGYDEARKFLWDETKAGLSLVETFKPDKYGRWLAEIYVGGVSVNAKMIVAGHAVPYSGGAR